MSGMSVFAILVGLVVGSLLGALLAVALRRGRGVTGRRRTGSAPRKRTSLLGTPAQRRRAGWIAAALAVAAIVLRVASGNVTVASTLMLLAVLLAIQTGAFALLARARGGRSGR